VTVRDRTISGSGSKKLEIAPKRFIKGVNLSQPTRAVNTALYIQNEQKAAQAAAS